MKTKRKTSNSMFVTSSENDAILDGSKMYLRSSTDQTMFMLMKAKQVKEIIVLGGGGSVEVAMMMIQHCKYKKIKITIRQATSSGVYWAMAIGADLKNMLLCSTHGVGGKDCSVSESLMRTKDCNDTIQTYVDEGYLRKDAWERLLKLEQEQLFDRPASFWKKITPNSYWFDAQSIFPECRLNHITKGRKMLHQPSC